jgi:hypothetical protein
VRLYVDDAYVGSTKVEGGRWLIETDRNVLTKPEQMVRIDVLKPDSSEVASRAEGKFVVDLPQPEAPVAVAENNQPAAAPAPAPAAKPGPAPQQPAPDRAAEPAAPAHSVAPEQPAAAPPQPAATPAEPAATPVAPTSSPAPAVAPEQPAAEPPASETPATPEQPISAAPEQPAAPAPAAPAESADAEVPTLVAEPVGDPEQQRFASGKAIIRRGDNLWTIARRVYGHGIKYTTIYTANSDQIRDPDLIYPGQVFDLPQEAD